MILGSVRLFTLALLVSASPLSLAAAGAPAVNSGSGGLESRYPAIAEWAKAGVRGGIPRDLPVLARVTPGNDLQAALDMTTAQGGGVVELTAGNFVLTQTLNLRSNVVLRGAAEGATRLHLKLRGHFTTRHEDGGFVTWSTGLAGRAVRHAGLERLTILFDSTLPAPPNVRTHKQPFINNPEKRDDLWVVSVRFIQSEDCWIDRCRILDSGTHPLLLEACQHVTVRATELVGAHNKGEPDSGSVVLSRSQYMLLDGLTVRDLRHLLIQESDATFPCRYNVLIHSQLAVDVTVRNGDAGHHLIEDCTLDIPAGHPWTPFGIGNTRQDRPPGAGTLIFRCRASHAFGNRRRDYVVAENPAEVYTLLTDFKSEKKTPRHVLPHGLAPVGGTLYAVP